MEYLLMGAKDALSLFTNLTKRLLLVYFILTTLALIFDLVSFISAVKGIKKEEEGQVYHDIVLTFLASSFLFVDYFYLLWLYSLSAKFPDFTGKAVTKGILGTLEGMHQSLGKVIKENKEKADKDF
mmetsp:Transcript_27144/g.20310  ORF Transcript_27144/g.20310 Transcript_27144/m.20310 type:complete len:126 (-) Transcript_27144:74-451(-)|eukprot:CAMPEP_0202972520 /NCGR_PEP_ID=MMETSP1396-20130829/37339_1 /ASSEMBLY_ACC=CAM_ASM_000872 /TAXON_ID= /ORGANISM="Pseudokeronopsis sp., Strain Brazil" /LENGTH=125 /DNA_ID=CAMNT_0049703023 /DNA_START=606 /DNA_END=983 /DNA_ORIENTATION=-